MKYKFERVKKLIKKEVMNIITGKVLKDPRIPTIMSITNITLSKDMHYCHIYISMIGQGLEISNAVKGLNSASGYIQNILSDKLQLRFTPKIEFRYDQKEEEAFKVEKLLDELSHEREKKGT